MPSPTLRSTLVPGIGLTVAGVLLVLLTPVLDLRLEAALAGAALGAALALISESTPVARLGSFLLGVAVAWAAYVVRAVSLPDTTAGRAVATALVLLLCTAIAAASLRHLPLWGLLLGAGTFAGIYELTYAAAPPEVVATSLTTATSLLVAVAAGFLVAVALAPTRESTGAAAPTAAVPGQRDAVGADSAPGSTTTVSIMEKNR